jgi:hypothetical protein
MIKKETIIVGTKKDLVDYLYNASKSVREAREKLKITDVEDDGAFMSENGFWLQLETIEKESKGLGKGFYMTATMGGEPFSIDMKLNSVYVRIED